MAARREEGWSEKKKIFMYFLACKGRSNDDVGVARGTAFQQTWPRAGFKTGDFVKKSWGGYRRTTLSYRRWFGTRAATEVALFVWNDF